MERATKNKRAGFSLIEVMVATAISTILLAAVLSSVLFFTRSGLSISDYHEMETTRRSVLSTFSRDVRRASEAVWANNQTLVLTIDGTSVTYAYSPFEKTLTRQVPGSADQILAKNLSSLDFKGYDRDGEQILTPLLSSISCKMIQLSFDQTISRTNSITTTSESASSRFLLRNKPIVAP
jgi:prepilin-type N-terminal cleavage/methylation domain-containing protein